MKKLFISLIAIVIVSTVIITASQLSSTSLEQSITKDIQKNFGINTTVKIIELWNITYLSYEINARSNITILNTTTLEINITNFGSSGYKWQSAICNLSGVNSIDKFEYNPRTNVWTSTGNLTYGKLINYGMPSSWCPETNGYGFVLFASTSQNKLFRLKLSENYKKIKMYTGSSSEVVVMEMEGIKEESGIIIAKFKANIPNYENKTITMVTAKKNGMV